jgi:hypothetical protein
MTRSLFGAAALALALALCAGAWAGTSDYYSSPQWSPGQGGSSSFSSGWMLNTMGKNAPFDSTITFIDNVSYSWHSTLRGSGTVLQTHWLSSAVKKGHCRANVSANTWAGCAVRS